MKRLWLALAAIALLLRLCLLNAAYAEQLTERLTGQLHQAGQLALSGQWEEASVLSGRAARQWEDSRLFRSVFFAYGDSSEISRSFAALDLCLERRDAPGFRSCSTELRLQLEELCRMEQLRPDNIL